MQNKQKKHWGDCGNAMQLLSAAGREVYTQGFGEFLGYQGSYIQKQHTAAGLKCGHCGW
jgi:hypothetical protein